MGHVSSYKKQFTLEQRREKSRSYIESFPDRIPVIVEKYSRSKIQNELPKQKFLVSSNMTMGQFLQTIRSQLVLEESQALFLFVNGDKPAALNQTLLQHYENRKEAGTEEDDGFLYVIYAEHEAFGHQ